MPPIPKMAPVQQKKFGRTLQRILKEPVKLVINDNTHVFLNARPLKKGWIIRLHWIFFKKPAEIAKHIGQYVLNRNKQSSKIIDRYIEKHWHWVRHPLPPIRTKGRHYDLQKMLCSLNRRYLKGKVTAQITWGPKNQRRAYEQMQMGSYSTSRNLIEIHPALDQKFVPRYVVEASVFHEMCHALVPVQEKGGRKQIHPPAFKKLEARYPRLAKAVTWEEQNFSRLLKNQRYRFAK